MTTQSTPNSQPTQQRKSRKKSARIEAIEAEYEKKLYDLRQMLEISKSLCSLLDYTNLIESILYICMCQMRVLGAGMFVQKDFDSDLYVLDSNYSGLEPDDNIVYSISSSHAVIKLLNETNETYTISDLYNTFGANDADIDAIASLRPSLIVPLKQKKELSGILLLGERIDLGEGVEFSDYDKSQILNIASLASIAINNATLVEKTTTDMMTHLKLKHYFYKVLSDKLEVSANQNLPLSCLMLDIDFFKKFNDTYGHACGDFVLQTVAKIISDGVRGNDLAGRYGGEEFVVMLYNTDKNAAIIVAERIRKEIERRDLFYEGYHMQVTISIGVSQYVPGSEINAKQLVDLADQALYVSKRTGRNKVSFVGQNLPESDNDSNPADKNQSTDHLE